MPKARTSNPKTYTSLLRKLLCLLVGLFSRPQQPRTPERNPVQQALQITLARNIQYVLIVNDMLPHKQCKLQAAQLSGNFTRPVSTHRMINISSLVSSWFSVSISASGILSRQARASSESANLDHTRLPKCRTPNIRPKPLPDVFARPSIHSRPSSHNETTKM